MCFLTDCCLSHLPIGGWRGERVVSSNEVLVCPLEQRAWSGSGQAGIFGRGAQDGQGRFRSLGTLQISCDITRPHASRLAQLPNHKHQPPYQCL